MASSFSSLLLAITPPSGGMRLPALECAPNSVGCKLHALERDLERPLDLVVCEFMCMLTHCGVSHAIAPLQNNAWERMRSSISCSSQTVQRGYLHAG